MKKRIMVTGLGLALAGYPVLWRRKCLTWGATDKEATGEMPGDDLMPDALLVSTRAVTVDAPPAAIWPWLLQMGPGRGGAYTYDWIENLFGLKMRSANGILPEFQDLKVGDVTPLGKNGPRMRVEVLDLEYAFVMRSEDGAWVWAFGLYPQEDGGTRLISRNRIADPLQTPARKAFSLFVMEPGSLLMERKMLMGIKKRAEKFARDMPVDPVE